jgi:hypothetical protein
LTAGKKVLDPHGCVAVFFETALGIKLPWKFQSPCVVCAIAFRKGVEPGLIGRDNRDASFALPPDASTNGSLFTFVRLISPVQ